MTLKKRIFAVLAMAIIFVVAANCALLMFDDSSIVDAATKIHLNKKSVTMTTGSSSSVSLLTANDKTISPSKVTWTTSSKSIVTVSKGKLKAIKPGTATIKAKYKGKTYSCKVTVKNATFAKKTLNMKVGEKAQTLKLRTALKKNIAGSKITWSSSNKSVATVSSTGKVTAVGEGTAKISAKYMGKTYKATVNVTEPLKLVYSGSGPDVIEIDLPQGLYKVTSVSNGDGGNFIVDGLDRNGDYEAGLANHIDDGYASSYFNEKLSFIEVCYFRGPWTIMITEFTKDSTSTITGTGDSVSSMFYLEEKPYVVKSTAYSGDSNFMIDVLDENGDFCGGIANIIGEGTVRKVFTPRKAGWYFIEVEIDQDAKWKVDFGEGDAVTTVNNVIENIALEQEKEEPTEPADKPSDSSSGSGSGSSGSASGGGSSSASGSLYEGHDPDDNLTILAAQIASKGKNLGNGSYEYSMTGASGDEISVVYNALKKCINFNYTMETSGMQSSSYVTYYLDTDQWSKAGFSILGTTPQTFCSGLAQTSAPFDPSTYYNGKSLGYEIYGTSIGLDGMTNADMDEIASLTAKNLWAATYSVIYSYEGMTLQDIGFSNYIL